MDAQNAPIRRRRQGVDSTNFDMGQKDDINLGDAAPGAEPPKVPPIEAIHAETLVDGRLEALAFNEEPVEIMIYPSSEENAPLSVPVWVNGRGAEVLMQNKWYPMGHLPVGQRLVTRRKYAEVLLRAKRDKVSTEHQGTEVERPQNRVSRVSSAVANISVLRDDNPKGIEWMRRCMAQPT